MNKQELLNRLESIQKTNSKAILENREVIENEQNFTTEAKTNFENSVLEKVQQNISEMQILEIELAGGLNG